jgi:hypothetical protein
MADARISEVVITLDKRWENDLPGALRILKDSGVEVTSADDNNSVIEGNIDVCRVHDLEKLDCVEYVRTVFTYDANYPPGDPRDRDGV